MLVTGDVSQGPSHSAAQHMDDKEYSLDAGLSRYNTERLTMDYSGYYVWRVPCTCYIKDPFRKDTFIFFCFVQLMCTDILYSNRILNKVIFKN